MPLSNPSSPPFLIKGTTSIFIGSDGKIYPVEILGTNIPDDDAVFMTNALRIVGHKAGKNSLNVLHDDANGYYGFAWYVNNALVGALSVWDNYELGIGYGYQAPGGAKAGLHCYPGYAALEAGAGYFAIIAAGGYVPSGFVIDGLDLSEYITAWKNNILLVTLEAAGYTNCVAGDINKVVTAGALPIGVLEAYDNTTRIWTVRSYSFTLPPGASGMAIVAGTGVGTSVAAAPTQAPTRKQNVKHIYLTNMQLSAAGLLSVYLTTDGTAGGTAIFAKRPCVKLSPDSGALPSKQLSADLKNLTIGDTMPGTANDPIDIEIIGEVA